VIFSGLPHRVAMRRLEARVQLAQNQGGNGSGFVGSGKKTGSTMSNRFAQAVWGGALIGWLLWCAPVSAASASSQEQSFRAHVLIVDSHEAIQKWVLSPPARRGGDNGRLRTVVKGTRIYLPLIASGYKPTKSGELHFAADLEIVAPDGKVTLLKDCCAAERGDPRTPGLVVLNPVIDISFDSGDPAGTYSARATVRDGSHTATASETFRVAAVSDAAAPARVEPQRKSGSRARSGTGADPRECLRFSTNLQVIACAEPYRYQRY
jgi:hypothetical protein